MWHKRRKQLLSHQIDCELVVSILLASIGLIGTIADPGGGGGGGSGGPGSGVGSGPVGCPSECECKWSSGKETVNCDKTLLNGIPVGIPGATQVLNISGINIQTLPAQVFRERRLINLQKLFMSKCKLGDISDDSFLQLTNLVEIDLCDNSLQSIPTVALQQCKSLRKLSLCLNPIRVVREESFRNLHTLVAIDLSSCQIDSVDGQAFRGLNELRSLRLDGNRLRTLAAAALAVDLQGLHALHLELNPWHCDCLLRPTVEWLTRSGVPQTVWPACHTPLRLEGHTFNALNLDEFSCVPVIHTQLTHFRSTIGDNLTIYCTVSGYPMPSISWKFAVDDNHYDSHLDTTGDDDRDVNRNHPREHRNPSVDTEKRSAIERVAVNQTFSSSYITINDLRVEDSQQLICVATNRGGSAYKNFTLTVSRQPPHSAIESVMDLPQFRITCYVAGLGLAFVVLLALFIWPLIRSKRYPRSVRQTSTLSPKLGPIDILQNVKDEDLEMKTIYTNKPEIALISDIIRDTTDLRPYRFGGGGDGHHNPLHTPDVTNFGPHYSAQHQLPASNRSSIISTSVSFDTFRGTPPPLPPPPQTHTPVPTGAQPLLELSEQSYLYNGYSNSVHQLPTATPAGQTLYDSRYHYPKQSVFNVMNNKCEPNGAVNECLNQNYLTLSASNARTMSTTTTTTATTAAMNDMTSGGQEMKQLLSHSQSHCLALDKELMASDLKATQNLHINANNSISVTQV